jgi:hypothetical protein
MAKMAKKLKNMFDQAVQQKVISLKEMSEAKKIATENINSIQSVKDLIDRGRNPTHAVYTNTLNLLSIFCEQVTALPPLHSIHDFISKWLDIYAPALPPMSPITNTYFTCWTLFDAAFGHDQETVGTCFLSLVDRLPLDALQIEAAKKLNESRMGIYEVLEVNGQYFMLREIITDKVLNAYICSGYVGKKGELIFIRLAAPLSSTADYYISLTTPYIFYQQSVENWIRYFHRHKIISNTVGVENRLYRHLKYGKSRTYWSEYIFYGYHNFGEGFILLTGFPDQANTQPQHNKYVPIRGSSWLGQIFNTE